MTPLNYRHSCAAAYLVLLANGATAQEVCVDLAKTIVFNTSQSFSLEERKQINKADLCLEEYKKTGSSKALQIEASYKFFSGGVAGNENQIQEEQRKQCEGKFGEYWQLSISSQSARTASVDALSVVNECLRLNSGGLTPRMTLANEGRDFSLTLAWSATPPVDLRVDHIGPRDFAGFKCSVSTPKGFKPVKAAVDVTATIGTGRSLTLSCERPYASRKVDGEEFTCYRDTLLSVATGGPSATIKVPQVCSPSMPGQRAAAIEAKIASAERRISDQNTSIESLRNVKADAAAVPRLDKWTNMCVVSAAANAETCPEGFSLSTNFFACFPNGTTIGKDANGMVCPPGWHDRHVFMCCR